VSDSSRMAEVAAELLGAKAVADLVRDVWSTTSPEVKQELADAILRRMIDEIPRIDLRWALEGEIKNMALEKLRAGGQLEPRAQAAAEKAMEGLENTVTRAVHGAIGDVIHQIQMRVRG